MPNGETITFGLVNGKIGAGGFTPIGGPGDAVNGDVTWTTYAPDGAGGTILNGVVNVTGNADPSGFFASLGLRSGYPGGQLALTLDVTCTSDGSPTPCIAAGDPSGTVNSAGLFAPAPSGTPEPATISLLGLGLAAILLRRSRRISR